MTDLGENKDLEEMKKQELEEIKKQELKEKRRLYYLDYRKRNKDKISEINKRYRENHPDLVKGIMRNYMNSYMKNVYKNAKQYKNLMKMIEDNDKTVEV